MNVFSIKKGDPFELSADKFEELTGKLYPYYRSQSKKNKKLSLYAICPECGNPIQIVNMYGAEMMQNKTHRIKLYAKHTRRAVKDFPYWDEEKKLACPLYKPSRLGNRAVREDNEYSEEIRKIIENNKKKIKKDIRNIVGLNITNKEMDQMYDVFMDAHAYSYRAVNKYNIPYSMLRYQAAIPIYGIYLMNSAMGEIVRERIEHNSEYFEISKRQIVKKKTESEYCYINMYFTRYENKAGGQYMHMVIYETKGKNRRKHNILDQEIEMKPCIYK
jgi:hypothetical protein